MSIGWQVLRKMKSCRFRTSPEGCALDVPHSPLGLAEVEGILHHGREIGIRRLSKIFREQKHQRPAEHARSMSTCQKAIFFIPA
jgi:hypothetical protein